MAKFLGVRSNGIHSWNVYDTGDGFVETQFIPSGTWSQPVPQKYELISINSNSITVKNCIGNIVTWKLN